MKKEKFVLRLKGEKKGHIFYDYTEEHHGKRYMVGEKAKYANIFSDKKSAIEIINDHDNGNDYEIVDYNKAMNEYYDT